MCPNTDTDDSVQPAFRGRFNPPVPAPQREATTDDTGAATAPAFPVLPNETAQAEHPRAVPVASEEEPLELSKMSMEFTDDEEPTNAKCTDCTEFFASEAGRCSMCARVARGEPLPVLLPRPSGGPCTVDDDEAGKPSSKGHVDFDDKMVLVGAAVVGAGIGAFAGSLAAVVGAGAGAYAATRPSGDRVGDAARYAGLSAVHAGSKAQEVGGQAASSLKGAKVVETASKMADFASHKARDVKLSERAADARGRLEGAASSINSRARRIDTDFQVSEQLQRATETVQQRATSMMRWASDQASLSSRRRANNAGARHDETSEEHC
mmetsp:Transcript_65300/g.95634  ORF Transcript_65300/g.95634 Transcript_65300/m.95634 type:complete len:323 (+) Transcript_65300:71-1039(+)